MVSSFATFSQSGNNSSPPSFSPSPVSDMEYYMFHNIDRVLFRRLIGNHDGGRRDPKEAIQIMGFWIWLEREVLNNLTLVRKLLDFQMKSVNDLCDEAVMCLRCVASDPYPFSDGFELVLMPGFVLRNVSFKYFYDNRHVVIKGVAKTVKEVCARTFWDILQEYARENSASTSVFQRMPVGLTMISTNGQQSHHDVRCKSIVQAPLHIQSNAKGKNVVYDGPKNVTPFVMPTAAASSQETRDRVQNLAAIKPLTITPTGGDDSFFSYNIEFGTIGKPTPVIRQPAMGIQENPYQGGYGYGYPSYVTHPAMQIQSSGLAIDASAAFMVNGGAATAPPPQGFPGTQTMFQQQPGSNSSDLKQGSFDGIDDIGNKFKRNLTLTDGENESPLNRSIFLTFSKGYPVSAPEIQEFFTKKFGKFIESIHMHEVAEGEQVMFARIVARSQAFVNAVVEGGTAKYNICGKHVWARKFEKNKKYPPLSKVSGPSTSSSF